MTKQFRVVDAPAVSAGALKVEHRVRIALVTSGYLQKPSRSAQLPLKRNGKFRDGDDTVATTVRISGDGFPPDVEEFVSIAESVMSNGIVVSDFNRSRSAKGTCLCGSVRERRD